MSLMKKFKLLTILSATSALCITSTLDSSARGNKENLKFNNGEFKIVQFTDTQDGHNIDERTIDLMKDTIEKEKPNLVLITGDVIDSRPDTEKDVKMAISKIAKPMEDKNIPWAITFGNHDEDHTSKTGMDKKDQMKYYMSFKNNINEMGENTSQNRIGDSNIVIKNSKGNKNVFNIYLFDSGSYASKDDKDLNGYAYITPKQISSYQKKSDDLAKKNNKKPLPSLAFTHIPVPEYNNVVNTGGTGSMNENPCPSNYNSGLFIAMKEKKDVMGIYVGHDHINDFEREYVGIKLGYAASAGYGTYGMGGEDNHTMRGARVFEIKESNPSSYQSKMVYHKDIKSDKSNSYNNINEDLGDESIETKKKLAQ